MPVDIHYIKILLADDDKDDSDLFREALAEIPLHTELSIVNSGAVLMDYLSDSNKVLPDIIFLDLNMPKKNGLKCLSEMKADNRLSSVPVIILSTTGEPQLISQVYEKGALFYIRKPNRFEQLKKLIHQVLTVLRQSGIAQPTKETFVLL